MIKVVIKQMHCEYTDEQYFTKPHDIALLDLKKSILRRLGNIEESGSRGKDLTSLKYYVRQSERITDLNIKTFYFSIDIYSWEE